MIYKNIATLCLIILLLPSCVSQSGKKKASNISTEDIKPFHLVFYNVENLFDTKDDPKTLDDDFTPAGKKNWSDNRYDRKIAQLTKVIKSMTERHGYNPAIIGLSEIENRKVVEDLAKKLSSPGKEYVVVHEESGDRRGIDVALMYRSDLMSEMTHEALRISFIKGNYRSRDILYVKTKMINGEELNVFVNHWPSRREGAKESEPKRVAAARALRSKVDEVMGDDKNAKIIIVGDFNDYPDNLSITSELGATGDFKTKSDLYNLAYVLNANDKGTYNYKGDWGMLDQAIVTKSLLEGEGISTTAQGMKIYQEKFMMYYDKKHHESYPSRTYGYKYYGGFSDHLPIIVEFNAK